MIRSHSQGVMKQFFRSCLLSGIAFSSGSFQNPIIEPASIAYAQHDVNQDSSLHVTPIDASFYIGVYRTADKLEAFQNGPVMRGIRALPVVQDNLSVFQELWDEPQGKLAMGRMFWDSPVLQEVLSFAGDVCRNDMFVWGDKSLLAWVKLSGEMDVVQELGELESPEEKSELLMEFLQDIDSIDVPTIVMGGKLSEDADAISKIDQIEMLLGFAKGSDPAAQDILKKLKRIDDDRGSRLTIEWTGDMIPWTDIRNAGRLSEEVINKLKSLLDGKSIAVTVGSLDGYFVLAVSPRSNDLLAWNEGEKLIRHQDMKPVVGQASKGLTEVWYISDEFAKAQFDANLRTFDQEEAGAFLDELLSELESESTEERDQFVNELSADLVSLNNRLMEMIPEVKGSLQYAWLTPSGIEQVCHYRTKNTLMDSSGRLELLNHLGGAPLVGVTTKFKKLPEVNLWIGDLAIAARKNLSKLLESDLIEDEESLESLEEAHRIVEKLWPSLQKLGSIYHQKLFPALSGEFALSVSADNLSSVQWVPSMPESSVALPIPEVAFIQKLDNPLQYREGLNEFADELDVLIAKLSEIEPGKIEDGFKLPRPEEIEVDGVTKFIFDTPEGFDLPEGIVPQLVYQEGVLASGYSTKQLQSLINAKPFSLGKGVVEPGKPSASIGVINAGKLLSVLRPWAQYWAEQVEEDFDRNLIDTREFAGADFSVTVNDLLSLFDELCKAGSYHSTTEEIAGGGTVVRTVYTQSLP